MSMTSPSELTDFTRIKEVLDTSSHGFLHEACLQLWGEAGERQVAGGPEVAIAASGGGPLASCLLLTHGR